MKMRNRVLIAKIQSALNNPADTSTGATVIRCQEMETNPWNGKTVDINPIAPYQGAGETLVVNGNSTFKATVALACGGLGHMPVAGVAPQFDLLMRAAGMQKTVGSSVSNTAQTSGTKSAIKLHAGASSIDDAYVGHLVYFAAANGAGTAQSNETSKNVLTLAVGASSTDNEYQGTSITVKFYTGTLDAKSHTSTTVYIPRSAIGSSDNLAAMDLTLTHSGVTETRKISNWTQQTLSSVVYDVLTVQTGFSFTPANLDTFSISEERTITQYNGTSKVATVNKVFKYLVKATHTYQINEVRTITNYDGTTKLASVDVPFSTIPNGVVFTIPEFVRYDPRSTGFEWLTADYWLDGVLHRYQDVQTTLSFNLTAENYPKAEFTGTGLLNDYTTDTMPAATFSNDVYPLPCNAENTVVIFAGLKVTASDISLDKGNQIVHTDEMGGASIDITDFKPTFSITLRATTPNEKDFISMAKNNAKGNFIVQHGVIGNMITLSAPVIALSTLDYSDKNGTAYWSIKGTPMPQSSGNNNFSIIFQ